MNSGDTKCILGVFVGSLAARNGGFPRSLTSAPRYTSAARLLLAWLRPSPGWEHFLFVIRRNSALLLFVYFGTMSISFLFERLKKLAGPSDEVIVRNMYDSRVINRAKELRIQCVPAVVIDDKLASCP